MKINRTTKRVVEILELVSQEPRGITLNEIASKLSIPTTSAFDIIHTLRYMGMIDLIDVYSKLYQLGPRSLRIGQQYLKNYDLVNIARPFIIDLAEKLQKTVFIAKESGDKIIYIYKHEPLNVLITMANIGNTNYMHGTSLGKAILAYSENLEDKVDNLDLVKLTENTITEKKAFINELYNIKKRGFSVDNEELEENMLCIGAPIFDHSNKVVAAISISAIKKMSTEIEKEGQIVRETADLISLKLGYIE